MPFKRGHPPAGAAVPGKPKQRQNGGRRKGSRGKATLAREAAAREALALQMVDEVKDGIVKAAREGTIQERAREASELVKQAGVKKTLLMKDIAFEFAHVFRSMAAFRQPWPTWHPRIEDGKPVMRNGRPVMDNDNPNCDMAEFKEYAKLAVDTALGAASYESPRLSAMMVGASVLTQIEVIGGLPDIEDGGLIDADKNADGFVTPADPGRPEGRGDATEVSPEAGGPVSDEGEAEGGPVRKAMG